jgi:peroxiredoxin
MKSHQQFADKHQFPFRLDVDKASDVLQYDLLVMRLHVAIHQVSLFLNQCKTRHETLLLALPLWQM